MTDSPSSVDRLKLSESFSRHNAAPEVSTEKYVRLRQMELAENVMTKQRVYLDTRYWILLRDEIWMNQRTRRTESNRSN